MCGNMPKKDESAKPYRPGVVVHPKKYSNSGGMADWGPLLEWFGGLFKKLWHRH